MGISKCRPTCLLQTGKNLCLGSGGKMQTLKGKLLLVVSLNVVRLDISFVAEQQFALRNITDISL
jgi:hypothetical protein